MVLGVMKTLLLMVCSANPMDKINIHRIVDNYNTSYCAQNH